MSVNANWALQESVHQVLASNAILLTELGGPKIYDDAPDEADYPYLSIGETAARLWYDENSGVEHEFTLHVWAREGGRKQLWRIMNLAHDALTDQDLPLEGRAIVNLTQEHAETRKQRDGESFQGLLRYRVVTETV